MTKTMTILRSCVQRQLILSVKNAISSSLPLNFLKTRCLNQKSI